MSTETDRSRLTVEELVNRFQHEMIPLSNSFSYFSAVPLAEDELKQYLEEPVAALPPSLAAGLRVGILLVPYLEKSNGHDAVTFDRPSDNRKVHFSRVSQEAGERLIFAIKEEEVSEYHYSFYHAVAELVSDYGMAEVQERFFRLIREELSAEVHGEVDEQSWHLKQALLRRQAKVRRETKMFREYARQAFIDTLTLYLHGICCDVDVETGPRRMASRYLRKRLELLASLYPPPEGYALFPEQLKKR